MTLYTPVIKLPKRKPSLNIKQHEIYNLNEYLVSDTLFLGKLPKNIRESDIRTLLQHCMPIEIKMDREKDTGQLRFSHIKYADRAYSLYNGFTFTNNAKLELQMYQDRHLDPEASACLLEVNGLPDYFDDNRLYDVFRPFGPLNLCKCVMNDGSFQGGAFIQFFHQNNSDEAQNNLDGHLVDGYKLSVAPYMPAKPMLQQKEKVSENNDNNAVVDIMNLYIKNLDPHITTQDLNRLFGQFGRIISARVMTNTATGQSKGYGFVSFGKPEEAAAALSEMNGCTVGSRQIIVAYHEPKKGRNNQQQQQQPQQQQQQQLQQQYRPTSVCQPHPYFDQPQPYQPSVSGLGIDHVDEIDMSMNVKDLSVGQKPMYRKPLEQYSPVTTSTGKSLASLASGASIQPAPPNYVQLPPKRPTLRRKGSLESVMTATSFGLQRAKLEAAVNRIGDYGDATVDIVDMLLTLKKKERSLCLFNPDFLKEKIDAALDALVTCEESEGSEDEETNLENNITLYQSQRKELTQITPVYNIASQSNNTTPPPKTKAIPIVAPPSVPSPPASSQATASKDNNEEAQALVASFEGKPIHEKKQLLGDKLFPLVKATGTKQAPKVTIRLLDTIDLYELAKIMFDTPLLKSRVEEAFNSLQQ